MGLQQPSGLAFSTRSFFLGLVRFMPPVGFNGNLSLPAPPTTAFWAVGVLDMGKLLLGGSAENLLMVFLKDFGHRNKTICWGGVLVQFVLFS